MALVDAGIPLGRRVDLHLGLDPVLSSPELPDLATTTESIHIFTNNKIAHQITPEKMLSKLRAHVVCTHMQVAMAIQFPAVLIPHYVGPRLSLNTPKLAQKGHIRGSIQFGYFGKLVNYGSSQLTLATQRKTILWPRTYS